MKPIQVPATEVTASDLFYFDEYHSVVVDEAIAVCDRKVMLKVGDRVQSTVFLDRDSVVTVLRAQ